MTTFDQAVQAAMSKWFSAGLADTVTLNLLSVPAHIHEQGPDQGPHGWVDIIDIEFQHTDYTTIDYSNDAVQFHGDSWRFPILVRQDPYTKTVRFRRNQRPLAKGRR